jgi:hypothetical protein
MSMGAHVYRHAVDPDRQVGAMVEIVTAQEVLVGFALTTMLRDDQPWRDFQCFRRTGDRALRNLLASVRQFAGGY